MKYIAFLVAIYFITSSFIPFKAHAMTVQVPTMVNINSIVTTTDYCYGLWEVGASICTNGVVPSTIVPIYADQSGYIYQVSIWMNFSTAPVTSNLNLTASTSIMVIKNCDGTSTTTTKDFFYIIIYKNNRFK